jgi:hypothetical protein
LYIIFYSFLYKFFYKKLNIKRNAAQLRQEAEKTQPEFLDPKRRARVAAAIAELEARIKGEKNGAPSALENSASKCMIFLNLFIFETDLVGVVHLNPFTNFLFTSYRYCLICNELPSVKERV